MPEHDAKLVHINPLRSASTLTLVALLMFVPLVGVMKFFQLFDPAGGPRVHEEWTFLIFLFAIVFVLFFFFTFLAAMAFNLIARITGGIPYKTIATANEARARDTPNS
jgi:hypothetical protein